MKNKCENDFIELLYEIENEYLANASWWEKVVNKFWHIYSKIYLWIKF